MTCNIRPTFAYRSLVGTLKHYRDRVGWKIALSAPQSSPRSVIYAHAGPSYLFEAAHEVVANRWPGKVSSAGAPSYVEEIIWAQHGVVFLRVASGGEDPIDGDGHLSGGNT